MVRPYYCFIFTDHVCNHFLLQCIVLFVALPIIFGADGLLCSSSNLLSSIKKPTTYCKIQGLFWFLICIVLLYFSCWEGTLFLWLYLLSMLEHEHYCAQSMYFLACVIYILSSWSCDSQPSIYLSWLRHCCTYIWNSSCYNHMLEMIILHCLHSLLQHSPFMLVLLRSWNFGLLMCHTYFLVWHFHSKQISYWSPPHLNGELTV